jgi:hypothetical protein
MYLPGNRRRNYNKSPTGFIFVAIEAVYGTGEGGHL